MLKTGIGAYVCGFLFNDDPVKLYQVSGALEKAGLWDGKHYRFGENRLLAAVSPQASHLVKVVSVTVTAPVPHLLLWLCLLRFSKKKKCSSTPLTVL